MQRHFSVLLLVVLCFGVGVAVFAQGGSESATVSLGGNEALGTFLVNENGMTLYTFANDTANTSTCTGECATAWPPLTIADADSISAGTGVGEGLGVAEREDGTLQVTYNRMPLYTFVEDTAAGEANGHGAGDTWFVARAQLINWYGTTEAGGYLSDSAGMSLYVFSEDTENTSNCSEGCAEAWPPFTVHNTDELYAGLGGVAQDQLNAFARTDTGTLQVTYQGRPLYYFADDELVGDIKGAGSNDAWFLVKPELLRTSGNDTLGAFLIGSDGMTLYTFAEDTDGTSTCVDECADFWPPLLVLKENDLVVKDEGVRGILGVTPRADGSLQVTYNGMPLYYFAGDLHAGDTTGHEAGDTWFVATPGPVVISGAGDITAVVDEYRNLLGQDNGGEPTSDGTGRREINWDGVPDDLASPYFLPPDFFNSTEAPRARGAFLSTPGGGVQASADSDNPAGAAVRFGNINPSYTDSFQTFSAERLFSPIDSNIVDLTFFVPGTQTPALVRGFGAVYTDVDQDHTAFEYFDQDGNSLGRFAVPLSDNGLSFLGVAFDEPIVARVRIEYGTVALGPEDSAENDAAVMDDFIYGEPVAQQ